VAPKPRKHVPNAGILRGCRSRNWISRNRRLGLALTALQRLPKDQVPIRINDTITLDAIVDSGATDVGIPADVVLTLVRSKTISSEDFIGTQTYMLADGSKLPSQRFMIKSLKVGNKTLENVVASIVSVNAQILLGQSFLRRFSSWSIDNEKHALILN
jgi:predicted aspartyl protease